MSKKSKSVGNSKKGIEYWWDVWYKELSGKKVFWGIEVESTHPDYKIVCRVVYVKSEAEEGYRFGHWIINELYSGRMTLKQARKYDES